MKDITAMAYVNMYGVLGALENLCAMDDQAKTVISGLKKPISLCMDVRGGPCCTFHFTQEGCRMEEGDKNSTCKMRFASPERFNALIDHSKPGLPVKGVAQLLSFLLGPFTKLTDRLNDVLRPTDEALKDRSFFEKSTILTMYTISGAISALANNDPIAKISASYTLDGEIALGICDVVSVTIRVDDHHFTTIKTPSKQPRVAMEFADIDLANGLFAGKISTINEMCKGTIRMSGMMSMADNVNRILDRVSVYLA